MYCIAISAGEASGDMFGGALAGELIKLRPNLRLWGAGGSAMQDAGVDVRVNMASGGTIGISETLKSLPGLAIKYHRLRSELLRSRPDVFVPIDCGALNVRLGQIAHANGIRVVYYLPPSSWRRRPKNAQKLLACGGRVITQFPWSAELLSEQGVDARFVGHPLLDIVKPTQSKEEFFGQLGLSMNIPTICLLPGSRSHEVREHLSMMIDCARIMHRELGGAQFVIGAANRGEGEAPAGRARLLLSRIKSVSRGVEDFPAIRVVEGQTYDCMAHSDFLITKSGTATLEAAILGAPMVIVYRGTAIMRFEFMFRKAILEDFIGLPNIIAQRGVCPELINADASPEKVADIALSIMKNENEYARMKASLIEVKNQLGESGAVRRAAEMVLEMGGLT
ncbi:MAG: lipid-A-disaccharide synthase [Armatimonadetes bacterium]|nr:lipid-A-disaccharide synthase [Armatimonadota bacterium]